MANPLPQLTLRLAREGAEIAYAGESNAEAFRLRVEAALSNEDEAAMEDLAAWVEALPPARRPPLFRAGRARLRAELAHRRGEDDAAKAFEQEAEQILRDLGARPLLALALLDRVRRHADETALAEARQILQDLRAVRWLERLDAASVAG